MRIVVAIDSMKGCLSSKEASEACGRGIKMRHPDSKVIVIAVGDGGEGTAAALTSTLGGFDRMIAKVPGPDGKEIDAEWWYEAERHTAIFDMASAAGLTLLKAEDRNPIRTTTFGVGCLIRTAMDCGANRIIIGMGGSATVDGGIGACSALGANFQFETTTSRPSMICGGILPEIKSIDLSGLDERLKTTDIKLVCDVKSPFTGDKGAARMFASQKGASPAEEDRLEAGMEHLNSIIMRDLKTNLNEMAGSGAAGGCAGGLAAIVGARIEEGASFVLETLQFEEIISGADAIVTGEGSSDRQTLMGKLPYGILQYGKKRNIPVILVAGRLEDKDSLTAAGFAKLIDINTESNIARSETEGENPLNAEVAAKRLSAIDKI